MTRQLVTVAALSGLLALAACSDSGDSRDRVSEASAGQVCRLVSRIAQDAKRDAFSLDYSAAERGFSRIIALYNDDPRVAKCNISFTLAQAHMNQGLVLSNQRKYLLADVSFREANRLLTGDGDPTTLSDRAQLGVYLQQHALNQNRPAGQVRDYAARTLELLDRAKSGEAALLDDSGLFSIDENTQNRRIAEAQTYYALGYADLSESKLDGVEERNMRAIDLIKRLPTAGLRARFVLQQAVAQAAKQNWAKAAATANLAAAELEDSLGSSPLLARALLVEATALSFTEKRERAYETFERAFTVYEENPVGLSYEAIAPFIRFVSDGPARGEIDETEMGALIFRAGQLVRGSFTAHDIAATAAFFEAGDTDEAAAVRDWREAESRLARLRSAQAQRSKLMDEQIVELERQIAEAAEQEADLRARRDELAPSYADALNAPVDVAAVQAALGEGEVLVQILTGDPRSTVLVIEPNAIKVHDVRVSSALLTDLVGVLRGSFEANEAGAYPAFGVQLAHTLHGLLFSELSRPLGEYERAFISSNGVLQSLPLDLLITQDPTPLASRWQAGDYTGLSWLGDEVELSYLPSARNLVDIRSRARASSASRPLIAFGGAESNATVDTILAAAELPPECGPAANVIASLDDLPLATAEVNDITAKLGGGSVPVVGAEFTEDAVLGRSESGELADFQVIHFATHGLLWPIEDCFTEPSLVTSVGGGAQSDGLLTSSEIRQMKLDAQFVVLSACDTAGVDGRIEISGENLAGLARAFFSSGSRSVMASHWKVEDTIAAEIMGGIYQRLGETGGTGFGAALKAAREDIRNTPRRSHPAVWSSFVVIGDGTLGLVPRGNQG